MIIVVWTPGQSGLSMPLNGKALLPYNGPLSVPWIKLLPSSFIHNALARHGKTWQCFPSDGRPMPRSTKRASWAKVYTSLLVAEMQEISERFQRDFRDAMDPFANTGHHCFSNKIHQIAPMFTEKHITVLVANLGKRLNPTSRVLVVLLSDIPFSWWPSGLKVISCRIARKVLLQPSSASIWSKMLDVCISEGTKSAYLFPTRHRLRFWWAPSASSWAFTPFLGLEMPVPSVASHDFPWYWGKLRDLLVCCLAFGRAMLQC